MGAFELRGVIGRSSSVQGCLLLRVKLGVRVHTFRVLLG